jgi:hypothetical protein
MAQTVSVLGAVPVSASENQIPIPTPNPYPAKPNPKQTHFTPNLRFVNTQDKESSKKVQEHIQREAARKKRWKKGLKQEKDAKKAGRSFREFVVKARAEQDRKDLEGQELGLDWNSGNKNPSPTSLGAERTNPLCTWPVQAEGLDRFIDSCAWLDGVSVGAAFVDAFSSLP